MTLSASLQLYDGVTGPLRTMHSVMSTLIGSFETMEEVSGRSVDVEGFRRAREELQDVGAAITVMEENLDRARRQQETFNSSIRDGGGAADVLGTKIRQFVGAYAGMAGIRKAKSWLSESLNLTDAQMNVERQLQTVLHNVGATEDAFESLKQTASSIQGYSLYGDEAMLGGAAELASYIKDTDAIGQMMSTLADYAAGMSGGGEVGVQQMVEYATQLGKALDGTLDGLKKKGFELTEAQKEIIENGSEMERALVIDEVISQSWAGLAEQMANLPQGTAIQLANAWGDVREEIGARLYPHILRFLDTIRDNMPQITTMVYGFGNAAGKVVVIAGSLANAAISVASAFSDNWPWIGPIIWGIVGAMTAYKTITLASALATKISSGATLLAASAKAALTGATLAKTSATAAATASQWGLNAAMLASPTTWVIAGIAAFIAITYAAVGAVNKFTGSSISATGIIAGLFAILAANVYNSCVVPIWNALAALSNFFGNVFHDPVAAVKVLFYDLAQTVIGYILNMAHAIEGIINKIPGVEVSITGGLDRFYNQLESASQRVKDDSEWVEYVATLEYKDYGEAFDQGYQFGQGLDDRISGFFNSEDRGYSLENYGFQDTLSGMAGFLEDTASNTGAIKDSVEISGEELKYLRDLAEQEVVNRFTTAEIKVEMVNHNTVRNGTDLDGMVSDFADRLEEELQVVAEGVH